MPPKNVAILLFDEIEVLDFAGPFEVFAVTSELNNYEPFKVYTVALEKKPIIARNGLSVNPDYSITDSPPPDILIVPGGWGVRAVMKSPDLMEWIKLSSEQTELTLSVCTGSLVLGQAGILQVGEATTHHENLEELKTISPGLTINSTARFVENGKVISSGGISAGIDMSLYVVEKLLGSETAKKTAVYMEYGNWRDL